VVKPADKAQVITELRQDNPLKELLKLAQMSRSTYYYHVGKVNRVDKYLEIKKIMSDIHKQNHNRYGYRRMTAELRRQGYIINHKTVSRIRRELGLFCTVRAKKYSSYRGEIGEKAPNILERNFTATTPFQKWVTDITEFHLFGHKIYLSPILDLYNGEIISYTISDHPRFNDVMTMLQKALNKLPKEHNLILHSDQGWQYRMKNYCDTLRNHGITQSMSRKGNCLDNAIVEGFFGHLKAELLYNQVFESIEHFIEELHDYIRYFNEDRIRSNLDYCTPVEYRLKIA
jgi:putative transposase